MLRKIFILTALCAFCTGVQAKVVLPDILSDNMVLQHSTEVNLWGSAAADSTVQIKLSWSDTVFECRADTEGKWLIKVPTAPATYEAQTITLTDGDGEVTLCNILLGEVWFCSGQSNMEMPLLGFEDSPIEHSADIIATSGKWKGIRVATVPKTPALEPQDEVSGKWKVSNPDNAPDFSATGYTFAMALNTALDIPVGIINCSWGGASVEGWSSAKTLSAYPDVDVEATFKDYEQPEYGWQWPYYFPMIMFNGMLHPLHNYTIRGFLWYQGCANVGHADVYAERLNNMVKEWRGLWGQGDIPFYMVEIAPYMYNWEHNGIDGALLRESQFAASKLIPNSGIVCTNDLVLPAEKEQIHPCKKVEIGSRLAYMALNKTYGYGRVVCEGPVFREMKVVDGDVEVYFDNAEMGLSPFDELVGFELAGEDKVFYPAEAKVLRWNKKVLVHSDSVPEPVAVRYCFKDFCVGNLVGDRSLPAFPFRSDNW